MRYFITSDIHSYYLILRKSLRRKGFDKNKDILITLGDNFDRGRESWKMYKFLTSLPNVILIRGNHEDLMVSLIDRGCPAEHDYHNGTWNTLIDIIKNYKNIDYMKIISCNKEEWEKIKDTDFYKWLTDKNIWKDKLEFGRLILTHSTIPNIDKGIASWREARWPNPYVNRIKDKILVCGHWFAWLGRKYANDYEDVPIKAYPHVEDDLIMLDSCIVHTKRCNILIYDDEKKELKAGKRIIKA